jgi:hypothetical protein
MAELPSMSLILTLASRNLFQDRLRFIATPDWHRFFRRPRHGAAGALFRLRPHGDGDDRSCLRAIYIEDGRLARKERVDCNPYQLRSVS